MKPVLAHASRAECNEDWSTLQVPGETDAPASRTDGESNGGTIVDGDIRNRVHAAQRDAVAISDRFEHAGEVASAKLRQRVREVAVAELLGKRDIHTFVNMGRGKRRPVEGNDLVVPEGRAAHVPLVQRSSNKVLGETQLLGLRLPLS